MALRPAGEWPALNQEINDGLRANWDERQAQRRANGTHERFCGWDRRPALRLGEIRRLPFRLRAISRGSASGSTAGS